MPEQAAVRRSHAPALPGAADKTAANGCRGLSAAPESRPCASGRMGVDRRLFRHGGGGFRVSFLIFS